MPLEGILASLRVDVAPVDKIPSESRDSSEQGVKFVPHGRREMGCGERPEVEELAAGGLGRLLALEMMEGQRERLPCSRASNGATGRQAMNRSFERDLDGRRRGRDHSYPAPTTAVERRRGGAHCRPVSAPQARRSHDPDGLSSLLAAARACSARPRQGRPPPRLLPRRGRLVACGYSTEKRRPARPLGLQSTLSPLGHPGTLLVPEIELWAARPGNRIRPVELQRIVKELRKRRRHRQALEISEWMNSKGHVKFVPRDHAVHLDLVGQVHGIEAAEAYFNNLSEKDRTEKT
ncbi:hypothetical protein PR202_ga07483 [Eleusine coracana subsp. coracana]|uniref:Uncharacterized protein n=1 Tax=Eleusine coracana subsp. coracana TaxID=191504 RepID=A0AAV5C060_ELECO|nr:hypothetical protein PR202_ga07483 [Eleusine coracana subsp. coracana]